jgi:hypothetical protein
VITMVFGNQPAQLERLEAQEHNVGGAEACIAD